MRVLAVLILFLIMFGKLALNVIEEDTVQYQHQMKCVKEKIANGIPRSAIKLTTDSCEVIK